MMGHLHSDLASPKLTVSETSMTGGETIHGERIQGGAQPGPVRNRQPCQPLGPQQPAVQGIEEEKHEGNFDEAERPKE